MLIAAVTGVDPETRRTLLVEGTQCAVRAGAFALERDPVRRDNIHQRTLAFQRLGVDALCGITQRHIGIYPFASGARIVVERRTARVAPTDRPWFVPLPAGGFTAAAASSSRSRGLVVASRYSALLATTWMGMRLPRTSSRPSPLSAPNSSWR